MLEGKAERSRLDMNPLSNFKNRLEPDSFMAYLTASQGFAAIVDIADGADILIFEAILVRVNN